MTCKKTQSLTSMPVSALKGVGPKLADSLSHLNILTVQDLLFHLPSRYEDRTRITPLSEAIVGNKVLIEGEIVSAQVQFGKKRSLVCRIQDGTGAIQLRFFHFSADQLAKLKVQGTRLRCFGELRASFRKTLEMVHPQYKLLAADSTLDVAETLTAIYPTTATIQQATWQKLISQALQLLSHGELLPEVIPVDLLGLSQSISLSQALRVIHCPPPDVSMADLLEGKHPAQQRLAVEELIAQQLGLHQLRAQISKLAAPNLAHSFDLQHKLIATLPYSLTQAQQKVIAEINSDLTQPHPMLRLVQGDVGSGKTIVATCALLQAVEHDMQAALMVPTEILAEQHYQALSQWLTPLGIKVALLTGSQTEKARKTILLALQQKEIDILIGTHALFQRQVNYAKLGLLVIDEQHRFGVHQRLALKEKGGSTEQAPHQLIMTATPIPRTLAMSTYADLDVSVIDELPPGRKPINTLLVSNKRRDEIISRVQANCAEGRQAYWVCTLIEDSETLQAQAAVVTTDTLRQELPDLKIGLIHGKQKPAEKEAVMAEFKSGVLQLLVATTVIEVGVDVPNASLMIIENSERLGLAQLHQLRGRVGRGQAASFCVLMYQPPLTDIAKRRLHVMRSSSSGFDIAEEDLRIRGPGELLGTKQTGLLTLKVADIIRDHYLLPTVNKVCKTIVKEKPEIIPLLIQRWLQGKQQYAQV